MSRVAKNPVVIPAGVDVAIDAGNIVVKGPLGVLTQPIHPSVKVERGEAGVQCSAVVGAVNSKAMSGTWQDASADNAGVADFFRLFASDGTTCHAQGTVTLTAGGGDMTLDNTNITAGQSVTVTSFTVSAGNA